MKTTIETGFDSLDNILHGLTSPSLIVVASRPSMGKTSFALNIVEHLAIKQNISCAVFSLFESMEEIVRKMLCSCAGVKRKTFQRGLLNKRNMVRLECAAEALSNAPIYVDDSPSATVSDIEAKAMRLQKERCLGLVVVDCLQHIKTGKRYEDVISDYLQLIKAGKKCKNRKDELSEISGSLRKLAKKLCVPIIVLCQLGRGPEYRNNKHPRLSDLRNLGSLTQDADTVLFIYRDEVYTFKSKETNKAEIIIGKHHNGITGKVKLAFRANITRFDNLADDRTIRYAPQMQLID